MRKKRDKIKDLIRDVGGIEFTLNKFVDDTNLGGAAHPLYGRKNDAQCNCSLMPDPPS